MNNQVFIPSNGIGELYLDVFDMHWYYYESTLFNIDKEIPFMKLLLEMASLRMRYYQPLNRNHLLVPQTIIDIGHTSAMLVKTFIKIKALSEDLLCTGDIETVDYCMEVYRQFLNHEPLDFFIFGRWEIELALRNMKSELFRFTELLERLFTLFYSLFPKKSKFRKNLDDAEQLFKNYLIKQFKKVIIKDGKYSSGIFGKIKGIFLERMRYKYFLIKYFFKIKKKSIEKKNLYSEFFVV